MASQKSKSQCKTAYSKITSKLAIEKPIKQNYKKVYYSKL
jgi:hypothetical protein